MTTAEIQRLEKEIQTARDRGDLVAVANLRFQLPLSYRNREGGIVRPGGSVRVVSPGQSGVGLNRVGAARVSISRKAMDTLNNAKMDGREAGGWLGIEYSSLSSKTINLTNAWEVYTDERSWRSIELPFASAVAFEEHLPMRENVCGCWHSHPDGMAEPSEADLGAWQHAMERLERPSWVGVIVTDDPRSIHLDFAAYVLHRGQPRAYRADIEFKEHYY